MPLCHSTIVPLSHHTILPSSHRAILIDNSIGSQCSSPLIVCSSALVVCSFTCPFALTCSFFVCLIVLGDCPPAICHTCTDFCPTLAGQHERAQISDWMVICACKIADLMKKRQESSSRCCFVELVQNLEPNTDSHVSLLRHDLHLGVPEVVTKRRDMGISIDFRIRDKGPIQTTGC